VPNTKKIRVWTDRSGSFKVEAEFIGLNDGKIHLHKNNGVKIAVPVGKMSLPDLEYVEKATGANLDEEKRMASQKRQRSAKQASSGASVEKKVEYDWFDFFLQCGVAYQICERYAAAFRRDEMSEENMPDITPELLRTLGVKEGDILRITKFLDQKYARTRGKSYSSFRRWISTN
jgi:actin cytoskeleton-regulatory complex protein SLA1